jgi:cyclic pyranopterin phosphate synthase
MPESEYLWLPRSSVLSFEEVDRLTGIFASLGVEKIRLTGGEPLLRQDLPTLVAALANQSAITEIALTTNAVLLGRHAVALRDAGLSRVTVSLDTVRADRYATFARSTRFEAAVDGIDAARSAGFSGLKLNAVVVRGFNDDELVDLLEFAAGREAEVRYIEYMDVGGATDWSLEQVVSQQEMLAALRATYGPIEAVSDGASSSAPAQRFRLPDGRTFGIIASTTAPFCSTCDRARITADGNFYTCLYADAGLPLRDLVRSGASDAEVRATIADAWRGRRDRGAEERVQLRARGVLHEVGGLRADPHREMHTRGG